uniref:Uncharacterized protein n=1 Tax=Ackermannviridae sp. TaxID=2831612 RepID=A0A8S5VJW0_9CAUD|nr:MAG TPA: hypothetical protein [Ackermannviridae sp.]
MGLEADGPSPISSRRYCLRTGILKILKFYFWGNPCIFCTSSRIGGMPDFVTKCISVTDDSFQKFFYGVVIVPRRASFSNWSAVVGVVFLPLHCSHLLNFIFECAGGTNIFVLGRALRTPPGRPHRGGYPHPLPCRAPGSESTAKKNRPPPPP